MENQNYTCPNPSCGRVFTSPVKTENLCSKNSEVYDACPFCLTEITLGKSSVTIEEKKHLKKIESEQTSMYSKEETPAKPSSKAQGCTHHFGYLSKRSKSEKIPEECMVCENIVQCMLQNVTG